MSKEDVIKKLLSMDSETVCEMMESKVTNLVFNISELMELSSAITIYLDSLKGLMEGSDLLKLKTRIDSGIINRLGTYGLYLDEEE